MINKILKILNPNPALTVSIAPRPDLPLEYFQHEKVMLKLLSSCSREELNHISRIHAVISDKDPSKKTTQELLEKFKDSLKFEYQYNSNMPPIEKIERAVNHKMRYLTQTVYETKQKLRK